MMQKSPDKGITVLLVDDHALLRRVLAKSLAALGYKVLIAESGDDAVRQLEAGLRPDLVLSDIRMPGKTSGLDLARWVTQHLPGCRILLQTGYTEDMSHDFGILQKPYTGEELAAALTRALD